jgi:T4 superinfection immunity protein
MADQQTKTDIKAVGWVIAISAVVIVLAAFIAFLRPQSLYYFEAVRDLHETIIYNGSIILAYGAPSIVAYYRNHSQRLAIVLLNILLGWTGIGWLAAFVWATWFD